MRTVIMADRNQTTEVAVVFVMLANGRFRASSAGDPALAGIDGHMNSPRIPNSPAGFPRVGEGPRTSPAGFSRPCERLRSKPIWTLAYPDKSALWIRCGYAADNNP